jgi:hypothetical protein
VLNASAREVDAALRHAGGRSWLGACAFFGGGFRPGSSGPSSSGGQATHGELVAVGQRWGRHFSEPWRVLFLTGAYVAVTVTFGVPLARLCLRALLAAARAAAASGGGSGSVAYAQTLGAPAACWSGAAAFLGDGAAAAWQLDCPALPVAVGTLVACLDAAVYIFFPIYAARCALDRFVFFAFMFLDFHSFACFVQFVSPTFQISFRL